MNECKVCGSLAINDHMHGRVKGKDLNLCDVCYWRKRADNLATCRLVGVDFELNSITLEVDPGIMKKGFNFGNVKIDLSSVQLR